MDISVVIPVFNEKENVGILHKKLGGVLGKLKREYEIIYVDDGSTDGTFEELSKLKDAKIIKFRKNFGQTAAMSAGFESAQGKIVIAMDADIQNDPADIPPLVRKIDEGYDVVSGWRFDRRDPLNKRLFSLLSNCLHRKLTGLLIHDSGCSLKAYRRECLEGLELYGEMHRFIPALIFWRGYKVGEVKVKHHPRLHGRTKYGVTRLFKGFLDLLNLKFWVQYSTRPLHVFGGMGLLLFIAGSVYSIYLTILKYVYFVPLSDRPSLLLSVLMVILGVQFIIFGMLADIIVKIYYSRGDRKAYLIEKKTGF